MLWSSLGLTLLIAQGEAFPSYLSEAFIKNRNPRLVKKDADCPFAQAHAKRQAPGSIPPFDASQQYVSNQGVHSFVPPSNNDQRGPCMYKSILTE